MCKYILFILAVLCFPWCAFGQFEEANLNINGTERTFHIYAPENLTGNPPLVFAVHGADQQASFMMDVSGWDEIADRENLVIVYPQGQMMNILGGYMPGWDLSANGADAQFFLAVIEEMKERYDIDESRIYETGFSMGGMMGYTLACSHADVFAAIAPASGFPMGGVGNCSPSRDIPILHLHGADDDFVPYTRVRDEILSHFRDRYDCPNSSEKEENYDGNSRLSKETWSPCGEDNSEISFISIAGAAHEYNPRNSDIEEGEYAWEFFKNHTLEKEVNVDFGSLSRQASLVSIRYAGGNIHLEGEQNINRIRLFDIRGKIQFQWQSENIPANHIFIPTKGFNRGTYLLDVMFNSKSHSQRVLLP